MGLKLPSPVASPKSILMTDPSRLVCGCLRSDRLVVAGACHMFVFPVAACLSLYLAFGLTGACACL